MHFLLKRAPQIAIKRRSESPLVNKRYLSIHEYQSMEILGKYGITIPNGSVASTPEEAMAVAKRLGKRSVVKAQVLAGGRGKGTFDNGFQGGVKLVESPEEAAEVAKKMIGHKLITKQTGSAGRPCGKVFVVETVKYKREFYLAILLDRQTRGPVVVGSYRGGMDIEAVAKEDPKAICKLPVPLAGDIPATDLNGFVAELRVPENSKAQMKDMIKRLLTIFRETDATLVEINPLVQTEGDQMMCIDAKLNFDDNAAFKHRELFGLRDTTQEDPREVKASKHDLNYIGLDGNIGCLVNGAGLAMATMDLIKLHGGDPANFLDVGGSATKEQVSAAMGILASDPKVKAILVNIFGGIMHCDIVASGIIDGIQKHHLTVPVVVRLQGTNEAIAKDLMKQSKLPVFSLDDLDAAARKVVSVSSN